MHTHSVQLEHIYIQIIRVSDTVESIRSLENLSVDEFNNFMRANIGVKSVRYLLARINLLHTVSFPPLYYRVSL